MRRQMNVARGRLTFHTMVAYSEVPDILKRVVRFDDFAQGWKKVPQLNYSKHGAFDNAIGQ